MACEADAFSSAAEMLALHLQQLDVKKEEYLEKRNVYRQRLLNLSIEYQKKKPLRSTVEVDEDDDDEDMAKGSVEDSNDEWDEPAVTAPSTGGSNKKRKAPMAAVSGKAPMAAAGAKTAKGKAKSTPASGAGQSSISKFFSPKPDLPPIEPLD
jgi:hypothetical protein